MSVPTRQFFIAQLSQVPLWDVIVIGGGATGLGIAVDSASRGLKTLLLEQYDFAKGTSSRSTKLIHGGVRYLAQGNISLVYSALRERGILLRNAPHLVKKQSFIIPCYSLFEIIWYGTGLKIYDWLSGRLSFGRSKFLSATKLKQRLPDLKRKKLKGGIEYFDGQFDDSRLAISLAQTAIDEHAVLLNYFTVTGLNKKDGKISGIDCIDNETLNKYSLLSKSVINAAGTFSAAVAEMDEPHIQSAISVSQGTHLVFNERLFAGISALMIPRTRDGRLLFVVPWHHHWLVGTTDTLMKSATIEPKPLKEEIDFILETLAPYLNEPPSTNNILSVFAGLRPLVGISGAGATKELSRDHRVIVSRSGLISITGGKWTTYRKMASDTVEIAIEQTGMISRPGITEILKIHGWTNKPSAEVISVYGSDAEYIDQMIAEDPALADVIVEGHPYKKAQVVWAVRNEMARTVEDVLARRIRLLFLDARASIQAASVVAKIMRNEMGKTEEWELSQTATFKNLAEGYLVGGYATSKEIDI